MLLILLFVQSRCENALVQSCLLCYSSRWWRSDMDSQRSMLVSHDIHTVMDYARPPTINRGVRIVYLRRHSWRVVGIRFLFEKIILPNRWAGWLGIGQRCPQNAKHQALLSWFKQALPQWSSVISRGKTYSISHWENILSFGRRVGGINQSLQYIIRFHRRINWDGLKKAQNASVYLFLYAL